MSVPEGVEVTGFEVPEAAALELVMPGEADVQSPAAAIEQTRPGFLARAGHKITQYANLARITGVELSYRISPLTVEVMRQAKKDSNGQDPAA